MVLTETDEKTACFDVVWCEPNPGGDGEGLQLKPAGKIGDDCGASIDAWDRGFFWSISEAGQAYFRRLKAEHDHVDRYLTGQWSMLSVRCVKD